MGVSIIDICSRAPPNEVTAIRKVSGLQAELGIWVSHIYSEKFYDE